VTEPDLLSVVYTSAATSAFDETELRALLGASRESNARHSVTGMLLYREGRFIQFLEGPERAVRELIHRIATDQRHHRVLVLLEERVTVRQFAAWTMGFDALEDEPLPEGFRRTFDDIEGGDDTVLMEQAARDLTRWYRERPGAPSPEPARG
jgi:hypothetical protein